LPKMNSTRRAIDCFMPGRTIAPRGTRTDGRLATRSDVDLRDALHHPT
jgi:hypothetical protein